MTPATGERRYDLSVSAPRACHSTWIACIFWNHLRTLSETLNDTGNRQAHALLDSCLTLGSGDEGEVKMHRLAKIRLSAAEETEQEPVSNYSLEIAAALLAVAILLVLGAQLVFAFTHALP